MRVLGSILTMALVAGCGNGGKEKGPEQLDAPATRACAAFEGLVAELDSLPEDEVRSQMLEM